MAFAAWKPPAAFNVLATLAVSAAAIGLTYLAWTYYEYSPWTRDGRVRVYTVRIAPEVSGTVVELAVHDNQYVHKGDVLFRIDPRTFENAVQQAIGQVGQARAQAGYLGAEANRRQHLPDLAVSEEERQNATGTAQAATDAGLQAQATLDQASLNLERAVIHSPVNGWVTNLLLQPGSFATTGQSAMTLVDAESFWLEGYFEETQLPRIRVGDAVRAVLLAYPNTVVRGRVAGVGRGIDVADAAPGVQGLPAVNPVFTWVRLAQRVPIHINLVDVPCPIVLSSGLTASITVIGRPAAGRDSAPAAPRRSDVAGQACDGPE